VVGAKLGWKLETDLSNLSLVLQKHGMHPGILFLAKFRPYLFAFVLASVQARTEV